MIIQTEKAPVGGCQPGPAASPLYVSGFIVRGPPKLLGQTHKGLDRRYDDNAERSQGCIPMATLSQRVPCVMNRDQCARDDDDACRLVHGAHPVERARRARCARNSRTMQAR